MPPDQLSRYAPPIGALVIILNGLILLRRGTRLASIHPERREAYRLVGRSLLLYLGIPAVAYALASMAGAVTFSELHFGRSVLVPAPKFTLFDGLFLFVWLAILAKFTFWLTFRGGAEFLVAHGDLFSGFPTTAITVKILWILSLGASLIAMLWTLTAFV